ncbi:MULTISPECIES: hypothetical protein [unclassified Variovorax]|uniref:hypothetical protein n=1 Tax=unclassified Variovorax TaxID=663243 RepID=UPI00076D1AEC|nr:MULTISPECIES: hypothetical protein [unclassified Variovorax]VTU42391.1 hypothetical protein H6P1_00174 [Variovorax sp. PBL-H6]KWT98487.1 hypothetical protein APY03_0622 [Variovorax sp. WDL1]PNG49838.1 hypothetical protein CHC06_05419 [Variovorax sp. B2]PNG50710.1 hypothetical protein CHC07_05324 [Variovorax sp. B4]VTU43987.1 hypothetical protein SRS16P1_00728 [Variovorax sp. SRS16]
MTISLAPTDANATDPLSSVALNQALAENEAELAAVQAEMDRLRKIRSGLLRQTPVACERNNFGQGCGAVTSIGELTYIQTHWYEGPHGCSGGDTWHRGEGQFVCPSCGHRNRLYNRKDVEKLAGLFRVIQAVYDR